MKLQDAYPFLAHEDEPFIHRKGALGRLAILGAFSSHTICQIFQALHNMMVATLGIS